ncbi:MAG: hypothetical protein EOM20_06725, partial [Spartobacteria bacterium]|nr:hypothetical protein [Spartobacteria bacterium]
MKRAIFILIYISMQTAAFGSTNTNLLAASTSPIMVDTNGVIVYPADWRATNDIASATNATALRAVFDATSNAFTEAIAAVPSITGSVYSAYSLQGTGTVTWSATQSWDFAAASNGTDWTYTYGATWLTNEGAKLYGPSFGVASTAQRLVYANIQSSYMYRVTWIAYLNTNDIGPSSIRLDPASVYYGASHAITTNVAIFTNTAVIEFVLAAYYAPYYISHITLEEANPAYISPVRGGLTFDASNRWSIGTAAAPAASIYATDYPLLWVIVTNADVTTYTPRRVGDMMLDVGS